MFFGKKLVTNPVKPPVKKYKSPMDFALDILTRAAREFTDKERDREKALMVVAAAISAVEDYKVELNWILS